MSTDVTFDDVSNYPVGAHIELRDAEWRILDVQPSKRAGALLTCEGVSELVRGRISKFYTLFEKVNNPNGIRVLRPEDTRIVEDSSAGYQKTKLYLEALMRTAPKTDPTKIEVAHLAAMDPMPYQFNPALQALSQPRARILIADAVGIGKTLEAGILTSELIARGRGRRILVLTTKAMLEQFQQEFWNRFTIPLVRLDSQGLQRVRSRIPANHNPFYYYDKSIISIDTLKQDLEYRAYLEQAYWDIIIIDEAHNVAQRNNRSQRAKLAQLLASRSDTMIMLSATPHDGRAESFASLMNILDPTAIANPQDYKLEDFADKGLVIRRFKANVREQVQKTFPDRKIEVIKVKASPEEDAVLQYLTSVTFETLDNKQSKGAKLFSTTLMKAFFSSPRACLSVIQHRLERLAKAKNQEAAENDMEKLRELQELVTKVTPAAFTKLQRLCEMLGDSAYPGSIGWDRSDAHDRLVIFTESIETLDFLAEELPKRTSLRKNQIITLKGSMRDTEIADAVNEFNRADSPVRVLLCSDVASEGINLHHFAHRMIHFDIPWSLMTFQQRNGRIDRYGQEKEPQIWYMQTEGSSDESIGDARVLELLVEKDTQAQKNLSDPAEFSLSEQEQEDHTARLIEGIFGDEESSSDGDDGDGMAFDNLFSVFEEENKDPIYSTAIAPVLSPEDYRVAIAHHRHIFSTSMDFAKAALRWMNVTGKFDRNELDLSEDHRILLGVNAELAARLKYLPSEVLPEDNRFDLTDDVQRVQQEMQRVRASSDAWPKQTLLWPLHPVMGWLENYSMGLFGRHTAPLVRLASLKNGERWILLHGGYPNRRGFIPIHRWVVVRQKEGELTVSTLDELITTLNLDRALSNSTSEKDADVDKRDEVQDFINASLKIATRILAEAKAEFDANAKAMLEEKLAGLEELKSRHMEQMELKLSNQLDTVRKGREEVLKKQIDKQFEDARNYVTYTATTENEAYIQLCAVFTGLTQTAA